MSSKCGHALPEAKDLRCHNPTAQNQRANTKWWPCGDGAQIYRHMSHMWEHGCSQMLRFLVCGGRHWPREGTGATGL